MTTLRTGELNWAGGESANIARTGGGAEREPGHTVVLDLESGVAVELLREEVIVLDEVSAVVDRRRGHSGV